MRTRLRELETLVDIKRETLTERRQSMLCDHLCIEQTEARETLEPSDSVSRRPHELPTTSSYNICTVEAYCG